MMFEEIHEIIEVIVYFDGEKFRPIRFRWSGRAYQVSQINSTWSMRKGNIREYHFHVSTKESGSFELIYNTDNFVWKIGRVWLYE